MTKKNYLKFYILSKLGPNIYKITFIKPYYSLRAFKGIVGGEMRDDYHPYAHHVVTIMGSMQ